MYHCEKNNVYYYYRKRNQYFRHALIKRCHNTFLIILLLNSISKMDQYFYSLMKQDQSKRQRVLKFNPPYPLPNLYW